MEDDCGETETRDNWQTDGRNKLDTFFIHLFGPDAQNVRAVAV